MKTDFEGALAESRRPSATRKSNSPATSIMLPKDIRAALDKNGLASPSCHVGYDVVEKKWPETLEAAKIVGHNYIICPWIDEKQRVEPGGWKRAADLFNRAGEASQKGRHPVRLPQSFIRNFDPPAGFGWAECSLMIFSSPKRIPNSSPWN